uniref:Putative ribonuclease H-like domain-containing protein n=1 Tax=Tanacetum cinerariifolium TaxID=118510 RepID=A0A6L2J8H0_TANCI|nr:putative ribonuclease H-like domain-containing protein [Tanacetum cinerariifolium]
MKGIKREFSVARTPQQNRVAELKNKTLIKASRTMVVDSLLPILFWADVVNTACYVQNRVLVTKPHNKTPYELILGRTPSIGFMRPFGCPVTILNTIDPLGKFDGKADEGFWLDTLSGPTWLFDIDTLTQSMNYQPVVAGNQPDSSAGIQENIDACKVGNELVFTQQYVLLSLWSTGSKDPQNTYADAACDDKETEHEVHVSPSSGDKTKKHDAKAKREATVKSPVDLSTGVRNLNDKFKEFSVNSTNKVNDASTPVTVVGPNSTNITNSFNAVGLFDNVVSLNFEIGRKSLFLDPSRYPDDPDMPALEEIVYSDYEEDVGASVDFSNLETSITVSPIPTTRVHKDHLVTQIIGNLSSAPQTRSMTRMVKEQGGLTQINDEDFHTLDLPKGKRAIGSKWVLRNKKDERGIVSRNKAQLFAQGQTQKEGIDYEEVFALIARIEAIRLFLAYASFMGFMVYKVVKALYGLHQAPGAWYEILANYLLENASTPIETEKPLLKDPDGEPVDVYIYSLMIGSLMYLTSSRPNIMFAVYTCTRFQVTPKVSHLRAVKRIFRYLKGKPHLGLSYPKDYPLNLVAYSDSDYAGASLDRKSTTKGCQFLGCRLISWQCKKQTVVDTSSTKVEYAVAASCCAQVLWIQNQLLNYGKKVIITDDTIRQALRLDDATGVDCIPNKEIFDELARMGYEKPSTKLTFCKAFFSAQWKFLIHTILLCMSAKRTAWNEFSSSMASAIICLATCRKFNFSKYIFDSMDVDDAAKDDDDDHEGRLAESQAKVYHLDLEHAEKVLSMEDTNESEPTEVEEVIEVVTAAKLITEVVTTTATTITVAQVPKASALRRRRGVIIQDPKETATTSVIMHSEVKSKDKGIVNRKEKQDNTVMRYQALTRKPITEAHDRKKMMIYLKNMVGFKMDFFRGMTYNKIRPIFEKHYNLNQAFLERVEE